MRIDNASFSAVLVFLFAWQATAQVLTPAEIADPAMRALQQSHIEELHAITAALAGHTFPYRFSFSRKLDLSERDQDRNDQRSIQFDRFEGKVVLKVTGNYFAAYSAERMTKDERANQTWRDVMLPILQAAVPALAREEVPDAFALEISHHVIRKVLGVDTESAENVVLILPTASARRLVEARDEAGRKAAVLEGAAYLNGAPISFWPGMPQGTRGEGAPVQVSSVSSVASVSSPAPAASLSGERTAAPSPAAALAPRATPSAPPEAEYRDTLAGMLKDLDAQAHFVAYAPPSFIEFRGGQYLEIAITTSLAASDTGSQYKLAALAFDRHVAHLIRPFLSYFKDSSDFTGIDFSTSVRLTGATGEGGTGEAVEFIFPLSALRSYAQYDLTGQQLIDAGFVLINGERAGLDLQTAEAYGRRVE
jgi:hypothetical protein